MNTNRKVKEISNEELTMLAHRKSFRARAKSTLKSLTMEPKVAQDSFKVDNTNMAIRGSSNADLSTSGGRENKKEPRSKTAMKGLTVDTKLARDTYNAENACIAANTRLARKASNTDAPRLSEAMMNRNWRNHRNPIGEGSPGKIEPLWSAPPEPFKFLDEVKAEPQREDEYEIIDYDHGLKRVAYRCRRPDDVRPELIPFTKPDSISADLCLSAPATKTEFSTAETGTEKRSAKYDPSIFQPSIKSVVRLDEMAPIKRAGYQKILNWDEQQRRSLRDSSSITIVSLGDPSSSWESVEFPYAEIRAVRGDKRFEMGLSNVEETIRNQLSMLVEPQSAGLPPDYIRKKYEEIQEERRKAIALAQSTIGTRGHPGDIDCNREASGKDGASDNQFNELLGKLNKLCAPRIRAFTVNDKDDRSRPNYTNESGKIMKGGPQSPSGDSGISGLSSGGRKRSSTLNPEAVEFCYPEAVEYGCPTQEKQSPATNGCNPTVSGPPVSTSLVQTPEQTSGPADSIRLLETRVAELEAQITRQQESKQEQLAHKRSAKGYKTNRAHYGPKGYGPMAPSGGVHHPVMNMDIQGSPGYQAAHPLSYHQSQPSFAMGARGMHPNPMPVMGNCGLPQTVQGLPPIGMPTGVVDQCNTMQAMIPFAGHGALVPTEPASGTPLWVKTMFGPKPVSKPDRPFRPGDGVQAMRQQEYEEYLEHLRVTDPSYALNCKQRQARRADRQRLPAQYGGGPGQKLLC
ncbi:hypothetical protein E0Z10_g4746 [Xylaria hypoxylon]|uniref:Uncharacterized protein n=1 Tax=Xylaria hypoxylon TaxID=37992 RepID=A0A4Z0Z399_9PEZI|nr:hypothetical protein E0Z10_g4746 [Xylaria hypoxylon]